MGLFSLNELQSKSTPNELQEEKSAVKAEQFLQIHHLMLESIKDLVGKLPEPGEIYFIWTLKSFNAFTFIPYLAKYAGTIDELYITTYSINTRITDALIKMMALGKIKNVTIYISETMRFRMPKVVDYLDSVQHSNSNFRVHYSWVHAKIAMVRIGDNYFHVEGSGNWAENAKHEQYIFLQSKEIFDFRKNWIEHELHS